MEFLEMMQLTEREFSGAEREKLAKSGAAMSDGSFPIETIDDLHNAIQAHSRAKNPVEVKAHIQKRAKALGAEDCLPSNWQSKNESARCIVANVEAFEEASTTYQPSTGNLTITVIKPGVSKNNRYYAPELLKKSVGIFEGAKMFMDHQTDKDFAARPNEAFKTNLSNLKKAGNLNQMGISIRAFGEAHDGRVGEQKCKIIESLLGCKSVDFVTFAGAGGQVESMSEAADPDDVMLMDVETLKAKRPDLITALEQESTVMLQNAKAMRTIKKHNGREDNGYVSEASNKRHDIFAEGDKVILENMHSRGEITSDALRVKSGDKPAAYSNFTEAQKKEFDFARLIGISEADALKLAALTK